MRSGSLQRVEQGRNGVRTMAVNIRYFSCAQQFTGTREDFLLAPLDMAAGRVRGETGVPGLKLDFCCGLRLEAPTAGWRVRISDAETGLVFYDEVSEQAQRIVSLEKYYMPWLVEVYDENTLIYRHRFSPAGRKVHFVCNSAIGDTLAFLPYLPLYRQLYEAKLSVRVEPALWETVHRFCPWLEFAELVPEDAYAVYYCIFMPEGAHILLPLDAREVPLWQMGRILLGLARARTKMEWPAAERRIAEPYVCIGVQASDVAKTWQYPGGWEEIVLGLRELGYRVLCIDREREQSGHGLRACMPEGAEDFTGPHDLSERADMLYHAEFFIGLSSGLAWLARTVGCPVVLIGGFSRPWHEFPEAYRVGNMHLCNGCCNDLRLNFKEGICQRQSRASETFLQCSKKITPQMVWLAITELLQDKSAEDMWKRGERKL